ncbi:hypothetical protein CRV24_009642 [Beauveria bassiana]|nr:hypothetical protein CRV24_009642 [Beauveria bassiana]
MTPSNSSAAIPHGWPPPPPPPPDRGTLKTLTPSPLKRGNTPATAHMNQNPGPLCSPPFLVLLLLQPTTTTTTTTTTTLASVTLESRQTLVR